MTLVVLAAGIGSRYGGIKQMDPMGPGGEFIIDYSVYDAIRAGFNRVVFVISRGIRDDFVGIIGSRLARRIAVEYAVQDLSDIPARFSVPPDRKKPWGTGHATLAAAAAVNGPFAVINADDFYGRQSFMALAEFLRSCNGKKGHYAMVGFRLKNTLSEFGQVCRGVCSIGADDLLARVVERTSIEKTETGARCPRGDGGFDVFSGEETVSMNMWGFTPDIFDFLRSHFEAFLRENAGNPKAEFYLPTVVDALISEGRVSVKVLATPERWFGVTYPQDKRNAVDEIRRLVANGTYPARLWAGEECRS